VRLVHHEQVLGAIQHGDVERYLHLGLKRPVKPHERARPIRLVARERAPGVVHKRALGQPLHNQSARR